MKIADQYFNNCREIAVRNPELMGRRVRYKVFTREDGIVVGANRAVNFIRDNTYCPVRTEGLKDGERCYSGRLVLIIEGSFYELVTLETTYLGFLSYSGAATEMNKIVKAADGVPVIDMSARHYPWQIIEETSLAAYLGGAAGTSTKAGYDYIQKWYNPGDKFKLYASLPHAMAAVCAQMAEERNILPSVMAAILFHDTFPDKPITILTDYEGRELDVTRQAFEFFGEKLFAVRLDTHGGRQMQGVPAPNGEARKYINGNGVTIEATFTMREFLDSIGAKHTKIVVSSGFNEAKVTAFKEAGAPMDFIGTGSWVKFMMFTADITHVLENGMWVPRTKVGRTHHDNRDARLLFERK